MFTQNGIVLHCVKLISLYAKVLCVFIHSDSHECYIFSLYVYQLYTGIFSHILVYVKIKAIKSAAVWFI